MNLYLLLFKISRYEGEKENWVEISHDALFCKMVAKLLAHGIHLFGFCGFQAIYHLRTFPVLFFSFLKTGGNKARFWEHPFIWTAKIPDPEVTICTELYRSPR